MLASLANAWRRPAPNNNFSDLLNYQPDIEWSNITNVATISSAPLFLKSEGGERGASFRDDDAPTPPTTQQQQQQPSYSSSSTTTPFSSAQQAEQKFVQLGGGKGAQGLRLYSLYDENTRLHLVCLLAWYLGDLKRSHFARPISEISDKEEMRAARDLLKELSLAFERASEWRERDKRSASPETTTSAASASGTFTPAGGNSSQSSSPSGTTAIKTPFLLLPPSATALVAAPAALTDPTLLMKSYGRFPNEESIKAVLARHHAYAWILVLSTLLRCTRVIPVPVQLRLMEHFEAVSMTSTNSVSSMSTSSSRNLGGGGGGNTSSDDVPERRRRPSGGDLGLIMTNGNNEALVAILAHVPKLNFLALGSACGLLTREKSKNRARVMNFLGPGLLMNRGEGSIVVSFRQMSVSAIALGNIVANAEALFEEEVGGEFFFDDAREEVRAHYAVPSAFVSAFGKRNASSSAAAAGGASATSSTSTSPKRAGEGVGKRRASAGALLSRLGNLSLNVVTSSTLTSSRNEDEELAVPRQSHLSQHHHHGSGREEEDNNNSSSRKEPSTNGFTPVGTMGKLRSMLSLVSGSSTRANNGGGEGALASEHGNNNSVPRRGGSFGMF